VRSRLLACGPLAQSPTLVKWGVCRNFVLLFFGAALLAGATARRGTLDPAFEKVPFDQWLAEGPTTRFHWKARVAHAGLSFHQRLMAQVEIALDGKDLETRRGDGEMVFLIQITDSEGTRYQDHNSIELKKLAEDIKAADLEISQRGFFLPGDYQLAVAIFDTATREHSATQMQFRVPPPPSDFLPDAWRDLPPVEFVDNEPSPEGWYLPNIQGRLQWAVSVHAPARLNVILNVAPSLAESGSRPTPSSGLAALLPTLKAISQTGSASLSENVDLLDLGRRRAVFQQNDSKDLDWPRLKTSLGDATKASIDIHSLSEQHQDAQFFVSQVRAILRASQKPSVLVVLTTAVAFEPGEDLAPISLEALPPSHVFYIRYRSQAQGARPFDPRMGGHGRGNRMGGGPMVRNPSSRDVLDQLEPTLKPLRPKVFDVETPEQMSKALKEIRDTLLAL
jgi:hypothetical protein